MTASTLARLGTVALLAAAAVVGGAALLAVARTAEAQEFRPLYRGTRASAMGGAFVAIADDEQAIFINPAGLAGVKDLTFNYLAADLEVSTDSIATALEGTSIFSNLDTQVLNTFMGKNIFAHAQVAPSLVIPHFGFAFLSDHQFALTEQNQANPSLKLGYQSTNGIQVAFGTSVLGRRAGRSDLRVGGAAKLMWRRGGYHELGFLDILNLTQDPLGTINRLNGDYGRGIGADLGIQYLFKANRRLTLSSGLAMTDVGDTTFGSPQADPQKSNLTFGIGASYQLMKSKLNFAYDLRQLLDSVEFRRRNHLGMELVLPFVSFQAGLYQMALTYGASFDLWMFRVSAASYSEEQGTYASQNPERRYSLRLALKVGL